MVQQAFKFGAFAFDIEKSKLTRNGDLIVIGQRAAGILARLLQANGGVVSKDDLFAAAWPGQLVEESNLSVQIAALRKALGQNIKGEDWIMTAQRLGYRFAVDSAGNGDPEQVADDKPAIAVLPFANSSGESSQDFFADGLTEDIITDLSNVPGFRVIARNSTLVYKDRPTDVREIAQDLKVSYIVEGSVRKSAARVRVNVQLVYAKSGTHVWAERFDRELVDVFALQDEIARRIVGAISGKLTGEAFLRNRPKNLEAYELCLRCRYMVEQSKEANNEAQRFLLRAIELEPNYAEAYRRLAMSYCFHWLHYAEDANVYRSKSLAAAQRAVELDPQDSSAYSSLAFVQAYERQSALANANFMKAIRLNSNDADAHAMYGDFLMMEGKPQEAIETVNEGLRLNPKPAGWYYWSLGQALVQLGRYKEAVEVLNREETYRTASRRVLAVALSKLGRTDEARTEVELFLATYPNARTSSWKSTRPFRKPEDLKFWVDAFKEVGLPD